MVNTRSELDWAQLCGIPECGVSIRTYIEQKYCGLPQYRPHGSADRDSFFLKSRSTTRCGRRLTSNLKSSYDSYKCLSIYYNREVFELNYDHF